MVAPADPARRMPPGPDDPVAAALALLDEFRATKLSGFLRCTNQWSGLDVLRHADVLDDIEQELALDCVEHAARILELSAPERNRRWFRLAQRHHYELRVRTRRRSAGDESQIPSEASPPSGLGAELDARDRALLDALGRHATFLGNGRLNVEATAAALGIGRLRLRGWCRSLGTRLGFDREHLAFWRRRLAEATCATAAARLAAGGELHLWSEATRRTPSRGALRSRLARIRAALSVRPPEGELRRELDELAPRRGLPSREPDALLARAGAIAPDDAAIAQWQFEAALVAGDVATAARCLRRAGATERDRVRIALARARFAEARGDLDRARRVLAAAIGRHGADARLVASLRSAGGAPRRRAPSAVATAPDRSRSQSA